jgi:hypothetical protein
MALTQDELAAFEPQLEFRTSRKRGFDPTSTRFSADIAELLTVNY